MAEGDVLDLVQQYDQMRSHTLGNGGGGMGRPQATPDAGGAMPQQQAEDPGEQELGVTPTRDQLDLVNVGGGVQIHRAIVPVLAEITKQVPGLHIVSGYRDQNQNTREGGVPMSRHLAGLGVDLAGSAKAMRDAAGVAQQLGVPEVSLEGPHLHLGFDGQAPRAAGTDVTYA